MRHGRVGLLLAGALLASGCAASTAYSGGPPSVDIADFYTLTPSSTPSPTDTLVPSRTPTQTDTLAPTSTPTATVTATQTDTPIPTSTPTLAYGTPATTGFEATDLAIVAMTQAFLTPPTPTNTPVVPKAERSQLVRPPDNVELDEHLWFVRPLGAGLNISPAGNYRYGMTRDGTLAPHHGVDIANPTGAIVVAAGPGEVVFAGTDQAQVYGTTTDFYGNVIVVKMADPWEGHSVYTLYGHLSSVAVSAGQTVFAGDPLGAVGATGIAGGPHLHFEVRLDAPTSYWDVRNPELWYRPISGRGALAGRVIDRRGRFIPGARVSVLCRDGANRYYDTYWDRGTPPDNVIVENFALSDLPAGFCHVEVDIDGETVSDSVEIRAGELSFVVLQPEE
ncbi:MAG: peptidoglycan DD-metalloendopeptidase family protein [Anaerolineales bacterium]